LTGEAGSAPVKNVFLSHHSLAAAQARRFDLSVDTI